MFQIFTFKSSHFPVTRSSYRVFSHDVTAAMLVSQIKPLGIALYFHANSFFCFSKPIIIAESHMSENTLYSTQRTQIMFDTD